MSFPFGECECRRGCRCEAFAGPAALVIERDGKRMNVCTRCDLSSDKKIEQLVTKDTPFDVFQAYDILGAFVLAGNIALEGEAAK